jgi:hypothetical protein
MGINIFLSVYAGVVPIIWSETDKSLQGQGPFKSVSQNETS